MDNQTDWTDIPEEFISPAETEVPRPSVETIKAKLDTLAMLRLDIETLRIEKEKTEKAVIPADVQAKIDAVNAEYAHKGNAMIEEEKRLTQKSGTSSYALGKASREHGSLHLIQRAGRRGTVRG